MTKRGHARNGISGLQRQLKIIDEQPQPLEEVEAPGHLKLLVVIQRALKRYGQANVSSRAASLTYYTVLSLFPILITAGNLLPVFGLRYESIAGYLNQLIPASILKWLDPIIQNLLTSTSGGVLSIGAVATLWAATIGISELKTSYNDIYNVARKRNFLVSRILGMVVILVVVAALALVMIAFTFGTQFLEWLVPLLGLDTGWIGTFNALRWPVALVALIVAVLVINAFMPDVKLQFRTVIPGSLFTVITWMALAQLFSLYMTYFGTKYNSYGTIGSFMVLLLWLNFSAMLLLLGAVINAECGAYESGQAKVRRGFFKKWFGRLFKK